ncbi:DUF1223 domain-containing protein [Winogradskyella immobilis]|uniref:DUF1223 domain-containing protein n=1 Tax=Winogradskyella immobilis TaxID=2816852 RepID=A0ABS8ELV1_9FLAO|nr:DUF1223 domain-containing protein [Winogradskyella immobilis]MCC1484194.1 DUF1223 domain-containing protein [Winogradskyella immobilis]MCG0016286.1 DUF1223 domain-containing protein [Winogradskyella immobilis]
MKSLFLTLFIIPFLLGTVSYTETEDIENTNPVVLELFTSQGCSSCPPADRLLKKVKSDNVITLSYHVDYWNYIGWKDPFSKADFTAKQERYAQKFYSSSIYTPQVVVNGREHFVGSNSSKLNNKIAFYSKNPSSQNIVVSNVKKTDEDYVNFNYGIEGNLTDRNLRVVLVIDERTTDIKRGENRNLVLTNSNIVVAEQEFSVNKTEGKGSIRIPEIVTEKDKLSLVLIVETDELDITAATQTAL